MGGWHICGRKRDIAIATRQLASKDSKDIQGHDHLAWNPARKKNESMKKTNQRSRTNPHNRNETGTIEKKHNRKEANSMVNKHNHGMMHNQVWCMSGLMRHGMARCNNQILHIKWSSICNELHIDETPQQLFSSIPFVLLINIKCWLTWQEVKHN
jgi:hypothetical protein